MLYPDDNGSVGYSSRVRLWLESEHGTFQLSQVGADFVIAAGPATLPAASRCTVVVSIDGREHRLPYVVLDGLSPESRRSRTLYREADAIPI